jgi:hypothetical protein
MYLFSLLINIFDHVSHTGSRLVVFLPSPAPAPGTELTVRVRFHTSPQSSALQWLDPAQTAGENIHTFLFLLS